MSRRLSGINPLSYLGVEPYTPPAMLKNGRTPTNNDFANPGDFWLVIPPGYSGPESLHVLVSLNAGIATWAQLWPASSGGASEFETDSGTVVPALGVVNILGDGVKINTTGSGNTITIHADSDVANDYVTDSGTATPSSSILNVVGGSNVHTSGSSNTVTVALNDSVTLAGDFGVSGSTSLGGSVAMFAIGDGVMQVDSFGSLSSSAGTDGQVLIGSTAGAPSWANITSLGGTISITNGANSINLEGSGGGGGPGTSCSFFLYQEFSVNIRNLGSPRFEGLGASLVMTKKFDVGNNTTTGDGSGTPAIFTAPVTGKYYLEMSVQSNYQPFSSAAENPRIQITTPTGSYQFCQDRASGPYANAFTTNGFSVCADLTSGDDVTFEVEIPTLMPNGIRLVGQASPFLTYFSGFLVGGGGGGGTIVSRFNSSGTWTKDANTQYVEVYGWCAGGGGASGNFQSGLAGTGGGGGGSYGVFYFYGPAFCFDNSVIITVGSRGLGGAGIGSGSPNAGGDGGPTFFGDISTSSANNSGPINGSGGGNNSSLAGTGTAVPGYWGDYTTTGFCISNYTVSNSNVNINPGTGGTTPNGYNGRNGVDRGVRPTGTNPDPIAWSSLIMSGGGGGGAGVTVSSVSAHSGGNGGSILSPVTGSSALISGGAGGNENTTINGGNGTDGVTGSSVNLLCGGSGGGGGGNQGLGSSAGNGGNGGFPGGGGGGGGGSYSVPSGSGGDGADGLVIVIEYL